MAQHFKNLLSGITDPVFLVAMTLSVVAAVRAEEKRLRSFFCVTVGSLACLYIVLTISTGGAAAERYLFPAAGAVVLASGCFIAVRSGAFRTKNGPLASGAPRQALIVVICLALFGAWMLRGDKVNTQRLRMYQPP